MPKTLKLFLMSLLVLGLSAVGFAQSTTTFSAVIGLKPEELTMTE